MTADARLAADLARLAGERLLALRAAPGLDPTALGDRADTESNAFLLARLAARRPGDAVLSEESTDDPARLAADRVWIIDPLDGTREYGLRERDDWAVHVALWQRGAGLTAAAVAQPALGLVHATDDTGRAAAGARRAPRLLVSATRPPEFAEAVADALGAELVPMGSAGAKAMAVVRGEADGYLHAGGMWEWDSAAPAAVAAAAGLHTSRVDGSPLRYNQPHPHLPDLLVCRPEFAAALLDAIRRAGERTNPVEES